MGDKPGQGLRVAARRRAITVGQSYRLSELMERTMRTIVEYTDQKPPMNRHPKRMISPPRSGPCCFSDMEEVGHPHEDGRWVFRYKRCRTCGFAVRVILREIPDAALAAELRKLLANTLVRNVPP